MQSDDTPSPDSALSDPGQYINAPYVTKSSDGPARLVDEHWKRLTGFDVKPLDLDLHSLLITPSELNLAVTSQGVHIPRGAEVPVVTIPVNVSTQCYNTLVITMRTDAGQTGTIKWSTDLTAANYTPAEVRVPLFPDAEFHTYRISFQAEAPDYWHGTLTEISLTPTDVAAEVEITNIKLAYTLPEHPPRLTEQEETREVLFGTQPPWTVTVPQGGQFEVALGVKSGAGRGRMIVRMKPSQDAEREIINEKIYPGLLTDGGVWITKQVDLSSVAGQEVTFTFAIDHMGVEQNDYFYWGNPMVTGRSSKDAIPVIVISCDTMRADHLSCYGYERETTPNLDAWAASDAVLFENVFTPETWTMPAQASILTGLYPKTHGATADSVLAESIVTLADVARSQGYLTAGFIGFHYWLSPELGFAQGYDMYNVPDVLLRDISTTNTLATTWLSTHPTNAFFLFLHNGECHQKIATMGYTLPYDTGNPSFKHFAKEVGPAPSFARDGLSQRTPEEYIAAINDAIITPTNEEKAYCIAEYDDCVRMIDYEIGHFFQELKERGLYDRALIIVTADHGEELYEHGEFGHAHVYDECAHVPLLIKFPGSKYGGRRIPEMVELIDIFPTVLDVLGLPTDTGKTEGRSLIPIIEGKQPGRSYAYIQRMEERAVRTPQYKLIYDNRTSETTVYDLTNDPEEQHSLQDVPAVQMTTLQNALKKFFEERPYGWHFAISHSATPVPAQIVLSSIDRIVSSSMKQGDRQDFAHNIERYPREIKVLWDQFYTEDEMVVRTANSDSPICLNLQNLPDGDSSFLVYLGQDDPIETSELRMVLDHNVRDFPKPENLPAMHSKPTVVVWYEPPIKKRVAAPAMSSEDREALDALGYGDSK